MLAMMRKRRLVERFEDDVYLLLEKLAVGIAIYYRCTKSLNLAGVIATTHPENHAPSRKNIRCREVLRKTQWMPHRCDVEAAPDFQVLGQVGEMDGEHQDVWDALVTLSLEVMLGKP